MLIHFGLNAKKVYACAQSGSETGIAGLAITTTSKSTNVEGIDVR